MNPRSETDNWYYQALDVRAWLDELPWRTYADAAKEFGIPAEKARRLSRISDLIRAGELVEHDARRYSYADVRDLSQSSDAPARGTPLPKSPVARGKVYRKWLDENPGARQVDAAEHFGVTQNRISQETRILRLPAEDQRDIEAGKLSVEAAIKKLRKQKATGRSKAPIIAPAVTPADDEAAALRVELTAARIELEAVKKALEAERRNATYADNETKAANDELARWKKIADALDLHLQDALNEINRGSYAAAAWKAAAKKWRVAARNYHSEGVAQSQSAARARESAAIFKDALRKVEAERRAEIERPRKKRFSFSVVFGRDE